MQFMSLCSVLSIITGKCTRHLRRPVLYLAAYRSGKLENLATCRGVCMRVCVIRIIDISDLKSLLVCVDCFSACFLAANLISCGKPFLTRRKIQ